VKSICPSAKSSKFAVFPWATSLMTASSEPERFVTSVTSGIWPRLLPGGETREHESGDPLVESSGVLRPDRLVIR
jgi:hypothetical protein